MHYTSMRTPVLLVSGTLSVGIALLASLVLVSTTRGQNVTFDSSAGALDVQTVASGLVNPWALAFLPDGRMLVTERPGRMRIVSTDGKLSDPIANVPPVRAGRQAGLLDLMLDRDFANNRTIYFCYTPDATGNIRLSRAKLSPDGRTLEGGRNIFNQEGPPSPGSNLGCRMVQPEDGTIILSLGDHTTPRNEAQNLANHIGKIVRITSDGSVPKDNPFVDRANIKGEIWSYGNRNPQGLALHPVTGVLWEIEHGPRGGDEVNIIEPGKNYGWPVIGYGIDYSGAKIHESTQKAGMEQPLKYWVPSISPSGLAFYTGDLFPKWKGSAFTGALSGQMLVRLGIEGRKVTSEERLLQNLNERIRDVRMGPDGALWLLTDNSNGRILRIVPAKR